MRILELFSGTESFSKVAEEKGHICFTIDINRKFNPDLCKDIMEVMKEDIPFVPDVVWASPPCEEYSHAKRRGIRDIETANKRVLMAIEIISWFPDAFWFIENPQTGLLKEQKFMKRFSYKDVSYCKYGMPYRKQTRIWTNLLFWEARPICKKDCGFVNDGKHIGSCGNGRAKYTNKHYNLLEKYAIPKELCLEIIMEIERAKKGGGK